MPTLALISVMLVCALAPASVHAQTPAEPPVEASAEEPPAAPPLVPAEPEPQEEPPPEPQEEPYDFRVRYPSSRMHGVPRVGLELVTGSLGNLTGAFVGLLAIRGAVPLLLFASGGAALGVYGAGTYLGDGAGRFGPTLGGAALAAVGSLAIYTALPKEVEQLPLFLSALMLPTLGAILGYEISQAGVDSQATFERSARADTGIRLVPVVARSPGGGLFGGLAGHF